MVLSNTCLFSPTKKELRGEDRRFFDMVLQKPPTQRNCSSIFRNLGATLAHPAGQWIGFYTQTQTPIVYSTQPTHPQKKSGTNLLRLSSPYFFGVKFPAHFFHLSTQGTQVAPLVWWKVLMVPYARNLENFNDVWPKSKSWTRRGGRRWSRSMAVAMARGYDGGRWFFSENGFTDLSWKKTFGFLLSRENGCLIRATAKACIFPLMSDGWIMNFQTFLLCFPENPGLGMCWVDHPAWGLFSSVLHGGIWSYPGFRRHVAGSLKNGKVRCGCLSVKSTMTIEMWLVLPIGKGGYFPCYLAIL